MAAAGAFPAESDFSVVTPDVSWNIFRYVGDHLHLLGVIVLLATIAKNKSVRGISRSTQTLYFLLFITRYLDLLTDSQSAYLVFFKLTYIATSSIALSLFWKHSKTYEPMKDTCNLKALISPCAVGALLLASEFSIMDVLWTFSEFLEGVAMVPQYIFCYRERESRDPGVGLYVAALGGYRVFYALNWIYKKYAMPEYSDIRSWIGGLVEIMFFIDFLADRFGGSSLLRSAVLTVDTKVNEISDKIEMKVREAASMPKVETEGGEMRRRRKADDQNLDV